MRNKLDPVVSICLPYPFFEGMKFISLCVCVCVCVCARARACAPMQNTLTDRLGKGP